MKFPTTTRHAHSRAHERFGLSFAALKRLGRAIDSDAYPKTRGNRTNVAMRERRETSGSATFVRGEGDREIWIALDGGREIPLVWDPRTKTIVTVLPRHALKELHRQLPKQIKHHES